MNWKVLAAGAVVIVPLVGILAVSFGRDPKALPDVMTGKPAPSFALSTLDGTPVRVGGEQGQPVVLNFWSTWCQPCKLEHADLQAAARAWQPKGVAFYGVLYNDEPALAKGYLARAGVEYPTIVDPDARVAIDYGVAGVPETFVIDSHGVVAHKFVGPLSYEALSAVLAEVE